MNPVGWNPSLPKQIKAIGRIKRPIDPFGAPHLGKKGSSPVHDLIGPRTTRPWRVVLGASEGPLIWAFEAPVVAAFEAPAIDLSPIQMEVLVSSREGVSEFSGSG